MSVILNTTSGSARVLEREDFNTQCFICENGLLSPTVQKNDDSLTGNGSIANPLRVKLSSNPSNILSYDGTDGLLAIGGGGGGNTIYSADDALAGNRVLDGAGNTLHFSNVSQFIVYGFTDVDGDTRLVVEEGVDDDTLRGYAGGTSVFVFRDVDQEIIFSDSTTSSLLKFEQSVNPQGVPSLAVGGGGANVSGTCVMARRSPERIASAYAVVRDPLNTLESGILNFLEENYLSSVKATPTSVFIQASDLDAGDSTTMLFEHTAVNLKTGTAGGAVVSSTGSDNQVLSFLTDGVIWRNAVGDQSYYGFVNANTPIVFAPAPPTSFVFVASLDPTTDPTYNGLTILGGATFQFDEAGVWEVDYRMTLEVNSGAAIGNNTFQFAIYDVAGGLPVPGTISNANIMVGETYAILTGRLVFRPSVGDQIEVRGNQPTGGDITQTRIDACSLSITRLS